MNSIYIYFRYYFYFAFFSIVSSTKLFFLCSSSPLFLSNPILCNPNVTTTTIQVISFVYVQSNLILYNPIHRLILFSPNSHQWWLITLVRANFFQIGQNTIIQKCFIVMGHLKSPNFALYNFWYLTFFFLPNFYQLDVFSSPRPKYPCVMGTTMCSHANFLLFFCLFLSCSFCCFVFPYLI